MDLPSHFKQPSSPLVDLNTIHSKNLRKIPQLSNEPSIPEPLLRPNNLPGPAKPNRIDDSSSSDDEDLNDPILRQARDLGPLAGKQSGGAEEGEKEEGKDEKDEEEEEDDEDDKQMENSNLFVILLFCLWFFFPPSHPFYMLLFIILLFFPYWIHVIS